MAAVWIPLAAELTPENVADNEVAPGIISELPPEPRLLLRDRHRDTPNVRQACDQRGYILVTSQHGRYPCTDPGVEVRHVFHKLRSLAIENFNEHFKGHL